MHNLQKSLLPSFEASGATGGVVVGTNVYTTQFVPIDSFTCYMVQIAYSGSPVASVQLEFSADLVGPLGYSAGSSLPQPINFDVVPGSVQSTTGAQIITYDVVKTASNWVRLKWTNESSTGTVTSIQFVAKGSQI